MMKILTVWTLVAAVIGSTSYASESHPQPGQVSSPQGRIDKVRDINNPPKSDSQAGRVIDSRDFQPKREFPHLEPSAD
jgi:hypothetical protein